MLLLVDCGACEGAHWIRTRQGLVEQTADLKYLERLSSGCALEMVTAVAG